MGNSIFGLIDSFGIVSSHYVELFAHTEDGNISFISEIQNDKLLNIHKEEELNTYHIAFLYIRWDTDQWYFPSMRKFSIRSEYVCI